MARNKNKKRVPAQPTQHGSAVHRSSAHKQEIQIQRTEQFSGPIPPANMLIQYASVDESLPNRIVAMAEKEQENEQNRHNDNSRLSNKVVDGKVSAERRGQWFAFIICLISVSGGIYLMSTGRNIFGFIVTLSTLAGLAYTFISGRRRSAPKN